MAGYCRTGRLTTETAPAIMTMMAMTHAKMGRSMKKRDNMSELSLAFGDFGRCARVRGSVHLLRRGHCLDRRARLDLLQTVEHHAFTRGEARGDRATRR